MREEEGEEDEVECEEEESTDQDDDNSDQDLEEEIRDILKDTDALEEEMKEMSAAPPYEGMTRLPCCAHKVLTLPFVI